ncbi:MAG: DUF4347 domain-containing protein, partial [Gammaproteobacteria bacterium]
MSRRPAKRRHLARKHGKHGAPRRPIGLEALEQRLLLSADLPLALQDDPALAETAAADTIEVEAEDLAGQTDGMLFDPLGAVDNALAGALAEATEKAGSEADTVSETSDAAAPDTVAASAAAETESAPGARQPVAAPAGDETPQPVATSARAAATAADLLAAMPDPALLSQGPQIVIVDAAVPDYEQLLAPLLGDAGADDEDDGDGGNAAPAASNDDEAAADPAPVASAPTPEPDARPPTFDQLADGDVASQVRLNADREIKIFVLDARADGLEQVSAILEHYEQVGAVHLLSHGSSGNLRLGTTQLNAATLKGAGEQLRRWGEALHADGDILLYGCDVAAGRAGVDFVTRLAAVTGADVAASTDATGAAARGGDWVLEQHVGAIEAEPLLGPITPAFVHLLNDVVINGTGGDNTIIVTDAGTNLSVTIDGGAAQIFEKPSGQLSISGGGGFDTVIFDNTLSTGGATVEVSSEHVEVRSGIDAGSGDIRLLAADVGHSFGGTIAEKLALLALGDELGTVVGEAVNDLSWPIDYIEADAAIRVDPGATLSGGAITLTATTSVPPTLITTWPTVNVLGVGASAVVDVEGSVLRASSGALTLAAVSTVDVDATAQSLGTPGVDAAGAVTVVSSKAVSGVSGAATLEAADQIRISADNTVTTSTVADGTAGGLTLGGASVAVSVVVSETRAYLDGAVDVDGATGSADAAALSVAATSANTMTTTAVATPGGASGEGGIIGKLLGTSFLGTGSASQDTGAGTGSDPGATPPPTKGTSPLSIAGSLALSVLTDTTEARLDATGGSVIDVGGTVDVAAVTLNSVTTKADGSTVGSGSAGSSVAGAGVAAAANVIVADTDAWIGGTPTFGNDVTAVNVTAGMKSDGKHAYDVKATSGTSAGVFGASGAFAMTVAVQDALATVAEGSTVTMAGDGADLSLEAVNRSTSAVEAGAQKQGATGIGAGGSFALNVGVNTTRALLPGDAALVGGDALSLTATGDHALTTKADAGSAGDAALTPAIALTTAVNQTEALLPHGADLALGGGLVLRATHAGAASSRANAAAAGRAAGCGIGIGLNGAVDEAIAELARG